MSPDATQTEEQILSWNVPESPIVIEALPVVLEEIRAYANEGLKRLSRGGIENGGVLYGERGENLVRILAWRPMQCEHAHGPGLVLSDKDRDHLSKALEAAKADPVLGDLHPLGWFVSHTRGGVSLTDADLQIYGHYFPWSWQIALVVRPVREGPAQAGFFFREPDGNVKADASYGPFVIEGPAEAPVPPPAPAPAARQIAPQMRPRLGEEPPNRKYWIWAIPLVLAGLVAAMLFYQPTDPNAPVLGLHLTDTNGELHVQWDKNSKAIRNAGRASLDVQDAGTQTHVPIDERTLREGSLTYARKSGDVAIAMTAFPSKGSPARELARFVGSPIAIPTPPTGGNADRDRLARQVDQLRAELRRETTRRHELENTVRSLQSRPAQKPKRRRLIPWRG